MPKPTFEDAQVMLSFLQQSSNPESQKARMFVFGDRYISNYEDFIAKYPPGTEENQMVFLFCGFFETIATLWKNELFNETLLFDWLLVRPNWERVKDFVEGARADFESPRLMENFEALANAEPG